MEDSQTAALKKELGELEQIIGALTGRWDGEVQAVLQTKLATKEKVLAAIRDLRPPKRRSALRLRSETRP